VAEASKKPAAMPEKEPMVATAPVENAETPVEKPTTFTQKPTVDAPVAVASSNPAPATTYREWKVEKKEEVMAKAEKPVVAVVEETAKMEQKISFIPGDPINGEVSVIEPDGGNYFLQLGSYKDRSHAEKGWKILKSQNADLLNGIDPIITEADLGTDKGGVFYRLQVGGYSDKDATMRLCGTLRDRSFDCFMPMGKAAPKPSGLAPGQRIAKSDESGTAGAAASGKSSDADLIADYKEGFGAL
jgi:cell division protein FtsN